MDSIITYLLLYNQYLIKIIYQLIGFIAQHIPLKQMQFDDSNSPKYQKFKVDKLPIIKRFEQVDYKLLLAYYKHKYNKIIKPVQRRNGKTIPDKIICPKCGATHEYIYDNNGGKGQYQCKVCGTSFQESNFVTKPLVFKCPYCGSTLTERKERKHFKVHKCTNNKCSYYLANLIKNFPNKTLKFIADGYSAYPLAKQQFELEEDKIFNLTQVIGLTNDDPVSTEFRWVKQVVERLNRTFKSSYRVTCGYSSDDDALYGFSLWTAYYNFLRPHPYNYWKPLNELKEFEFAENMPAKWQILISLGQQTILQMQESDAS